MTITRPLRLTRAMSIPLAAAALLLAACSAAVAPPDTAGDSHPGDVLASQPVQLFVAPGVPFPGTSQLIAYRSTDHTGEPVRVTGTVTTPLLPWPGPGPRPIVSFAIGTHGLGDACAPSFQMARGIDFEAAVVPNLLALGYAVAITDYTGVGVGVGSDGDASYLNRRAQGHAVLDILRAARRLPAANLPDDGPVATFGYSQGGLGSAAAIELHPSYAPDLNLIAGYAGSIPSDQRAVLDVIDRSASAGLMGNFISGLDAAYPDLGLAAGLNSAGRAFVAATAEACVPLVLPPHALTDSRRLFADGRALADHLRDAAWQPVMADQDVGLTRPEVPVLVVQSVADDVVPDASTRGVVERWCALGATVEFLVVPVPGHFPAGAASHAAGVLWLRDRFEGRPAAGSCDRF